MVGIFWLIIASITTVGFGDLYPVSIAGKVWTTVLMIVGCVYMGIPIGIVGNAFGKVWDDSVELRYIVLKDSNYIQVYRRCQ